MIITEITSSGENIAGEKYNLTCTVVINGTHDTPRVNITWNSTISADIISYDNETYMSVLQFDPLQESHHDHYQCSVAVADIVEDKQFYFSVQGKFLSSLHNVAHPTTHTHTYIYIYIYIHTVMQYQWFMLLSMEVKILQL